MEKKTKNLNPTDYLTTLKAKFTDAHGNTEFSTEITFESYSDLAYTISCLIGISACALQTQSDNVQFTENEKYNILGANTLSIQRVLLLAKQMIPFEEFEFLGEVKKELEV